MSAGEVLSSDLSGKLSWINNSVGSINEVTGGNGIKTSTASGNATISLDNSLATGYGVKLLSINQADDTIIDLSGVEYDLNTTASSIALDVGDVVTFTSTCNFSQTTGTGASSNISVTGFLLLAGKPVTQSSYTCANVISSSQVIGCSSGSTYVIANAGTYGWLNTAVYAIGIGSALSITDYCCVVKIERPLMLA